MTKKYLLQKCRTAFSTSRKYINITHTLTDKRKIKNLDILLDAKKAFKNFQQKLFLGQ